MLPDLIDLLATLGLLSLLDPVPAGPARSARLLGLAQSARSVPTPSQSVVDHPFHQLDLFHLLAPGPTLGPPHLLNLLNLGISRRVLSRFPDPLDLDGAAPSGLHADSVLSLDPRWCCSPRRLHADLTSSLDPDGAAPPDLTRT